MNLRDRRRGHPWMCIPRHQCVMVFWWIASQTGRAILHSPSRYYATQTQGQRRTAQGRGAFCDPDSSRPPCRSNRLDGPVA